jgi:hypothetical protein
MRDILQVFVLFLQIEVLVQSIVVIKVFLLPTVR